MTKIYSTATINFGGKMIIYKATNIINNKVYIGATKHSLKNRKNGHIKDTFRRPNKNPNYFHKALIKYSLDNFKWEIIDYAENYKEVMQKEKYNLKNGIANVCRNKKKTAAGYRWSFYNETNHDNTVPN